MAVSTSTVFLSGVGPPYVMPVSIVSDWQTVLADGEAAADGNPVTNPGGITDSGHTLLTIAGATSVMVRAKYKTAMGTDPVVQVFGKDRNGLWHRLKDAAGTHEQTLADASTDVSDGTNSWTEPFEVDADGSTAILVCLRTTGVCAAGAISIEAKVK